MFVLVLENVEVIYDKVFFVIKGVLLEVGEGEMVVLFGLNGVGKLIMLKLVLGLLGFECGLVMWGDVCFGDWFILGFGVFEWVGLGLVYVLEGWCIFGYLMLDENLIVVYCGCNIVWFNELCEQVYVYFLCLCECIKLKLGYLLGGEQQMLVIGCVLMIELWLIMLDELLLGLLLLLVQEIFGIICDINVCEKLLVLLVEQNVVVMLDIVDRVYLIEQGQVVMLGVVEVLKFNFDVQDFYLGGMDYVDYCNVKYYCWCKCWLV